MLFGLFNVLASFQAYINNILAKKLNIFVIVYLNNIFIYTQDPDQAYANAIQWVFEKLRKYSLFANLKKCQFYKVKICFLNYVVSAQRVKIEAEKREIVKN